MDSKGSKMIDVIDESRERQDARMAWWREARFGMFIHFGLGSLTAGMRRGACYLDPNGVAAERAKITTKDDRRLAERFNPLGFNAKEWVRVAKDAGMRWIVFTAKHHDGFCLWDTKLTDFSVVGASPFGRDMLKELAEACGEEGMRLGIYYSQRQDWHHPDGGNELDYDLSAQSYSRYLQEHVKPQLRELLTNYGPIAVVWFDTGTPTPELALELKQVIRELQPDTIINGRVSEHPLGHWLHSGLRFRGFEDYIEMGDHEIPNDRIEDDWETPATVNNSWFHSSYDHDWKSTGTLIQWLVAIVSRGGNYLLNVGPTAKGVIPEPAVRSLRGVGKWLQVNGESIFGATAGPIPSPVGVPVQARPRGRLIFKSPSANPRVSPYQCTSKPGRYYIHVFSWPWDGELKVSGVRKEVLGIHPLAAPQEKLEFSQDGEEVVIRLPEEALDPVDTVLVLRIGE
jgi:alpha-L-fucosidase